MTTIKELTQKRLAKTINAFVKNLQMRANEYPYRTQANDLDVYYDGIDLIKIDVKKQIPEYRNILKSLSENKNSQDAKNNLEQVICSQIYVAIDEYLQEINTDYIYAEFDQASNSIHFVVEPDKHVQTSLNIAEETLKAHRIYCIHHKVPSDDVDLIWIPTEGSREADDTFVTIIQNPDKPDHLQLIFGYYDGDYENPCASDINLQTDITYLTEILNLLKPFLVAHNS